MRFFSVWVIIFLSFVTQGAIVFPTVPLNLQISAVPVCWHQQRQLLMFVSLLCWQIVLLYYLAVGLQQRQESFLSKFLGRAFLPKSRDDFFPLFMTLPHLSNCCQILPCICYRSQAREGLLPFPGFQQNLSLYCCRILCQ